MKYGDLLDKDVYDFLEWLDETFKIVSIDSIKTNEEMELASSELLRLYSLYSYISELSSWAKARTRELKRSGKTREHEDMIDKKDAIENKMNAIKQAYAGISRAVTIKTEINTELRMTNSRYIA